LLHSRLSKRTETKGSIPPVVKILKKRTKRTYLDGSPALFLPFSLAIGDIVDNDVCPYVLTVSIKLTALIACGTWKFNQSKFLTSLKSLII